MSYAWQQIFGGGEPYYAPDPDANKPKEAASGDGPAQAAPPIVPLTPEQQRSAPGSYGAARPFRVADKSTLLPAGAVVVGGLVYISRK